MNNDPSVGSVGGALPTDQTTRIPVIGGYAKSQRNPSLRQRRLLLALLVGQRTREEVDRIAGASNGPDEVLRLRKGYGLSIPCTRKGARDRDGNKVEVGVYRLEETDRAIAKRLLVASPVPSVVRNAADNFEG